MRRSAIQSQAASLRKFLGFSISNDGSERRIAPKALDKFKGRIRDMTRRTRGFSLQQLIKELKPYIMGWRSYFGFCQTPRVLTNLEAWSSSETQAAHSRERLSTRGSPVVHSFGRRVPPPEQFKLGGVGTRTGCQVQRSVTVVDRSLIFDVGCNDGQDSDFYLKKGFRVVAVEANPALCERLKERFAEEIAEGRFVLVEEAIAEHEGEVEFYLNEKEDIRSTIMPGHAERASALGRPPTKMVVPSITFPSLIERFGVPYFMKVDIEGADWLCLEGLTPFDELPLFLSTEYPLSLAGQIRVFYFSESWATSAFR